ncbi:MAG: hypothetical protein ABW189_05750 [Rickettsiales bacterium]
MAIVTSDKPKIFFIVVLLCLILVVFWSDRYPGLIKRYASVASGNVVLLDKISPDAGVAPNDGTKPLWERTAVTAANWAYTNRKGMTFGVLFGAGALTLLSYVRVSQSRNRFVNAFGGMLAGMPLGVCANCVTPIAKCVAEGGARHETALAASVASPGLNPVVLSMLFAAFPFHLAIIKLSMTLLVILVAVPLVVGKNHASSATAEAPACPSSSTPKRRFGGVSGACLDYAKNLWYVFSRTVPLMIAAGLLGALVANLVDFHRLAAEPNALALGAIALISTFLPVPMAFDVMFAHSFMASGGAASAASVMLTSLGSYSVLSALVVRQTMGTATALKMYAVVAAAGMAAGLAASLFG